MDTNTLKLSGGNYGGCIVDVASQIAYIPSDGDGALPTINVEIIDEEINIEGWLYRPTGDGTAVFIGMK